MNAMINNIPTELRSLRQWVCSDVNGKNKIPKNPITGYNASVTNPSHWGTFDEAIEGCKRYGYNNIGFVFTYNDDYVGVDIDDCSDNPALITEFADSLCSYTEYSVSGSGIHIICKGSLPEGARRRGKIEMYSTGRCFVCTGNIYSNQYLTINERTEQLALLHHKHLHKDIPPISYSTFNITNELDDDVIIDKASKCRNGDKFDLLYSGNWCSNHRSQSEADLALCNMLAYWTGRNADQMDRIFRSSGLMRGKWDERHGSTTYGQATIHRAIEGTRTCYDPNYGRSKRPH